MSGIEEAKIRGWARKEYAAHRMSSGQCVSRRFRRPDGSFTYGFNVTWVPGTVALSGDLGEISVVHYSALRNYREGMEWLSSGSYDYLMGKCSPRDQVFDHEETSRFIVEMANSDLRDVLIERRAAMKEYVRAKNASRSEWSDAFEAWVECEHAEDREEAPKLVDYAPDREAYLGPAFAFVMKPDYAGRSTELYYDKIDERRMPDGYGLWFSMWKVLRDDGDVPYEPECIFVAAGRRAIREAVCDHLSEGGMETSAKFCSEIGIDDFYGSQKFHDRTVWQIEALKHGASMMLAESMVKDRQFPAVVLRAFGRMVSALRVLMPFRRKSVRASG